MNQIKLSLTLITLFFISACAVAQKEKKESPAAKISEEAYRLYKEEDYVKAVEVINKALK